MIYCKDKDGQVFAYEDGTPEFGSYNEVKVENENGEIVTQRVYNEVTIREGLIVITEDESNLLLNPPKSEEQIQREIVESNTVIQINLTKEANDAITILQDAIDFEMQESGDEDKLKALKKYRILLTRVDLTTDNVVWPEKPE